MISFLIGPFIGINENDKKIEVYVLTGKMWAQENDIRTILNTFFCLEEDSLLHF